MITKYSFWKRNFLKTSARNAIFSDYRRIIKIPYHPATILWQSMLFDFGDIENNYMCHQKEDVKLKMLVRDLTCDFKKPQDYPCMCPCANKKRSMCCTALPGGLALKQQHAFTKQTPHTASASLVSQWRAVPRCSAMDPWRTFWLLSLSVCVPLSLLREKHHLREPSSYF